MTYSDFIESKTQFGAEHGFEPCQVSPDLFPFQSSLVDWAVRKGRAAIFADCGLGKTAMQLSWAENVARHTDGKVLILTPLAVAHQHEQEGHKFGIDLNHRRDGIEYGDRIVVTNYERLHLFRSEDFDGVVCDESSILKGFDGATRKAITEFMRTRPYRLLCTATAAPNDYIELGTSSEALGEMGAQDMINRFFKKSKDTTTARHEHGAGFFALRPHATRDFWRWICSWARAIRSPSDLGFSNDGFHLPPLNVRQHCVKANSLRDGYLFDLPAVGLDEQRADLRRTIGERCQMAADIINSHDRPAVAWCNLNEESSRLAKRIYGAVEVSGSDSEDEKEAAFNGFADGTIRVLVTKPSIAGFGLNWQHCAHQTFFPSHSYEQYYQAVRRSWRFGQKSPVTVDVITTDGQENVLRNLQRKSEAADAMFAQLVAMMSNELKIQKQKTAVNRMEIPAWL